MAYVYKHLDKNGRVLYVGCSVLLGARTKYHQTESSWFKRVSCIMVERFETKKQALEVERQEILRCNPPYNKTFLRSSSSSRRGDWFEMLRFSAARDEKVKEYRRRGWTLQRIADKFDISRQRVHQICKQS